jgi:uncharacterized membrane protein
VCICVRPRLVVDIQLFLCILFAASAYSRAEQQTTFLLDRQMQFKQAAMAAKTSGDIELAKKYLRLAKVSTSLRFVAAV